MSGAHKRPVHLVTADGRVLSRDDVDKLTRSESEELVGRLATEVWRLARRFERIPEAMRTEAKPIGDSVARLTDALGQYGVELQLHDGQVYNDGLRVEVLAGLEPTVRLVVAETVEPSVVWGGRIIRQGKVTLKRLEA